MTRWNDILSGNCFDHAQSTEHNWRSTQSHLPQFLSLNCLREGGGSRRTSGADDDRNDEAVDTEDTRHDDGHDRLHDQLRAEDTHGGNADACLRRSISSAETCTRQQMPIERRGCVSNASERDPRIRWTADGAQAHQRLQIRIMPWVACKPLQSRSSRGRGGHRSEYIRGVGAHKFTDRRIGPSEKSGAEEE